MPWYAGRAVSDFVAKPWIGDAYGKADGRHLILGESSHCEETEIRTERLRTRCYNQIWEFINHGDLKYGYHTPLFERSITQVLGNSVLESKYRKSEDRNNIWNKYAFINYITESAVSGGAGFPPTNEQWASGAASFKQVLTQLAPTHILVIGLRLWEHILADYNKERGLNVSEEEPTPISYRFKDQSAWIGRIHHPGGWGTFFWVKEARVAAQLFARPDEGDRVQP